MTIRTLQQQREHLSQLEISPSSQHQVNLFVPGSITMSTAGNLAADALTHRPGKSVIFCVLMTYDNYTSLYRIIISHKNQPQFKKSLFLMIIYAN